MPPSTWLSSSLKTHTPTAMGCCFALCDGDCSQNRNNDKGVQLTGTDGISIRHRACRKCYKVYEKQLDVVNKDSTAADALAAAQCTCCAPPGGATTAPAAAPEVSACSPARLLASPARLDSP